MAKGRVNDRLRKRRRRSEGRRRSVKSVKRVARKYLMMVLEPWEIERDGERRTQEAESGIATLLEHEIRPRARV